MSYRSISVNDLLIKFEIENARFQKYQEEKADRIYSSLMNNYPTAVSSLLGAYIRGKEKLLPLLHERHQNIMDELGALEKSIHCQ